MNRQEMVIVLAIAVAGGCVAERSKPAAAQAAPAPSSRPAATAAPGGAAAAPPARIVDAVGVRAEGRHRIRTFELRPGDAFRTERGGTIRLSAIRDRNIVLDRTHPGWTIPARPAEHSIGNGEYIRVVSVDQDAPSLQLELRTITKKHPWEALSF